MRHAVYRVFNDRVDRYSVSNKKLTVVTDNFGWDGSGWSKKQAIRDGKRQIEKLTSVLPEFGQQIDRVEITVTYLKQPVMMQSIDN
jgi:Acyl CoA:acetate/3-ketoacid CoA transferase, alpha subunit